ncbi:MAG: Sensor histidine kinase RcsC [Gemmatimonadaceae bacterium]|nr:Sensor histidine kinase RcsC [Gemmatimonadaceae bacterium]
MTTIRDGSPPFGMPSSGLQDADIEALLEGVPESQAIALRELIRVNAERAWRLQRIQGISGALSRTLDASEVMHELARGVQRTTSADGVFVLHPDLDRGTVQVVNRLVDGVEGIGSAAPIAIDEGAGVVAQAARTGEALLTMSPSPVDRMIAGASAIGCMAVAPLMHGRRLLGLVGAFSRIEDGLRGDDVESLRTLASQSAIALSNAQLFAESERERRQSEALAAAARAVGESLRMGEVMRLILRHATALLRADGGGVALLQGDYLNIVAAVGAGELLKGVHLPVGASVSGRVVREGITVISNNAGDEPGRYRLTQRLANIEKVINVPLTTARGPLGVLSVFNRADDFLEEDARVLRRLADQVTVAIVNARLYEELSDATREWTATFDAIASAMVIVDDGCRIARYNTRALQMAKVEGPRELVGRPFYETFLGEAPSANDDLPVERAMRDGVTVRGVLPAPAMGTALRVSAAPHANGGAIVTLEEERTLPHVLDRSARVIDAALDALLTLDPSGLITSANPAARQLFGQQALEGVALRDLVPEDEQSALERACNQALVGVPQRSPHSIVSIDGDRRQLDASFAPLSLAGGVEGVVVWIRDVTDERSRAEALARSEGRYAQLVETAPDAIVSIDSQGRLTAANKVFEVATGRSREEMLGRPVIEVIDPRDRELAEGMLQATLAGQIQRFELRFIDDEGQAGWASITASPLMSGERASGLLAIVRNTTHEKRVLTQMLRQERMAAVGHLVSGLSHELNNPLASVMALGELLLESPALPREELDNARMILDETRRAAKIIGNLLAFARQQPARKTPADVNVLLAQAVDMRRYALQLDNIAIELALQPNLPPVLADVTQLQQVVLNLIANSEQVLRNWPGERRLSLRTRLVGSQVAITVQDTGPGIGAADRDRIFDPFFTTRGVGQGTGLGLSVADGIVREHGGRIHVDSTPGAGATFIVEIPIAPRVEALPGSRQDVGVPMESLSVLVVDDEPTIREALSRYLVRLGHHVDLAANGLEARARLASLAYDRILLDVRMPGLAGDALYRELVERAPSAARGVIFLTGDAENDPVRVFLESSGRPCISKPFTLDDVRAALHQPESLA